MMCDHTSLLNGLFPAGDLLQDPYAVLQAFKSPGTEEISGFSAMFGDGDRRRAALEIRYDFRSLSFEVGDEFRSHKWHKSITLFLSVQVQNFSNANVKLYTVDD